MAVPGLEALLAEEARGAGFAGVEVVPGGVSLPGGWPELMRANLVLRGATRVLWRIGQFRALHLAQLDKRARRIDWAGLLRSDVPVAVEAACRRSRIYHAGAAAQRVATAISEALGAPIAEDAPVRVMVRIEDDLVTLSIDTTGASLHKRGFKEAVNRAPMRETMAALFLRACGFSGQEPVYDPMCGSGTFPIEAAEIAAGLLAGRARGFAFEHLAGFDAGPWARVRGGASGAAGAARPGLVFSGSDRDAGAIRMSLENAERAGVAGLTRFSVAEIGEIVPPEGKPGLVIVNPPYGGRIGEKGPLIGLHREMGRALKARFSGWRVGIITADRQLAEATGLTFLPPGEPVLHGGIRVTLYRTGVLG
ncbi:putative N6-adenine-specific DNA methylase [Devosia enhydra]|uniref:Putative N6-adenine-specific DNA methylase n=1 Tax=Devosia enhydra TaxID=665118 RepID=A0A1K2I302_9HYPH|nr:RNA methyltransferase [Devosia enhydra]SFZ86713.1 putative N6-adenine-specific DNA methylase [Devosia enhydra]